MEINLRGPKGNGLFAIVDVDVFEKLNKMSWSVSKDGYAINTYRKSEGKGHGSRMMHRVIMNPPQGMVVDHINGNRLDNRKENLRVIKPNENQWNMKKGKLKTATSKYKGVSFMKDRNKWRAQIGYKGKVSYLGFFDTEKDAALAYNNSAKEKFGDLAKLNEVPEHD